MALSKIRSDSLEDTAIHGNRNLIINGAMLIHQRGTSTSGISGSGYYVQDRHKLSIGNTAGRLRMSSSGVAPDGFATSLRLQCTTSDTSIAADEYFNLQHRFEGQNLQLLKKGTSNAEQITVSFYMKTNKAFTFMCELDDPDNNRFNGQQFTTTTDWTRHVLTFAGDTSGALDNDANQSMRIMLWFHAGSNSSGGTYTANTWQSRQSTDANRAVGIGSFFDSTDNEIRLTGLQMEIGSKATPFEHRSYGDELQRCQRYFLKTNVGNAIAYWNTGGNIPSGSGILFPTTMRATPTATVVSNVQASNTDNGSFQNMHEGGGQYLANFTPSSGTAKRTDLCTFDSEL